MRCGVGGRCSSDLALLWLWRRSAATAPIGPLAWEPPYAAGVALEKDKQTIKKSPQAANAGEGVEKRGPSCTVGGNLSWSNHYGDQYGGSSRKLKTELLYNVAIPLLGIYPDKTTIQKDTCTHMFIAALFIVAKTWKQPRCPLTDDWIKRCGTYTQWNTTQP